MNTFKRGMLIQLREKIVEDLHVSHILNYLLTKDVINIEEREKILAEKTRKDQARRLLDLLPNKGSEAFDYFVESLKVDYDWLYTEFVNSDCRAIVNEEKLYNAFVVGGVPHAPPYNVHREKKLAEIRAHLKQMKRGSYVVLHGMTGAGKSCLAAASVIDPELLMLTFRGCVYWLSVGDSSDDDILSHMVQLLQRLGLNNASAQANMDCVVTTMPMAKEQLKLCFLDPTFKDGLLVIDDVTSAKLIDAFDIGCKIMVTTKDMEVMKSVKGREKLVEIKGGLTETESLTILAKSIQGEVEKLPPQAKNIHYLCQGSPMVMALIAGQLEDNIPDVLYSSGRWEHYVQMLSAKQYGKFKRTSLTQEDGLFCTIRTSVDNLSEEKKQLYLDFALFLEDVNIKPEVLQTLWSLKTKYEVEDIMSFFTKKSLAVKKWNEHFCSSVYGIHDLLLFYLKNLCTGEDRKTLHRKLLQKYHDLCRGNYAKLPNDNYIYSYIGYHLHEAQQFDMFPKLFFDMEFLGSKLKVTGPADVLLDFRKYRLQIIGTKQDRTAVLEDLTTFVKKYGVDLFRYKDLDIVQCALQEPRNSAAYQIAYKIACAKPKKLYFKFRLTGDLISHPQTLPFRDELFSSCFANSKNTILVADGSGTIHLFDLEGDRLLWKYTGHQEKVTQLQVHPNYSLFLSCSNDTTVKLWNLYVKSEDSADSRSKISPTSPQCLQRNWNSMFLDDPPEDTSIRTLRGHTSPVLQATFSHSGKEILSCSRDQYIVWNCDNGERLFSTSPVGNVVATCCAFSKDDSLVFLGGGSAKVHVYTCPSGEVAASFCVNSKVVAVLTVPNRATQIVVVTKYNIRIWEWEDPEISLPVSKAVAKDLENSNHVKSFSMGKITPYDFADSKSSFVCVVVSKDGVYLVAAAENAIIQTWDLKSRSLISEYRNYSGIVKCLDIYLDSRAPFVLCCSEDTSVKLWHLDLVRSDTSPKLQADFHAVWNSEKPPETPILAVTDSQNVLKVLQGNSVIAKSEEEVTSITVCCPSYGALIFYGCADGQVKKFDLSVKTPQVIMKLDKKVTYLEAFEHDDKVLVAAAHDKSFKIWRKERGVSICYGQVSPVVRCFLIVGKGWPQLLSCGRDATIKLWNTADGKLAQVVVGGKPSTKVIDADMTAARNVLVLGDVGASLLIVCLSVSDGNIPVLLLNSLVTRQMPHPVTCCRIAPGDSMLLAGLHSGTVMVCSLPEGQEIRRLELHTSPVHSIHFPSHPQPQILAVTVGKLIGWWNITHLCATHSQGKLSCNADSACSESHVEALAENNHCSNIWLCKEGHEERPLLLGCIKLVGSHAVKISSSHDFMCFATIDKHGTLHLLHVLK